MKDLKKTYSSICVIVNRSHTEVFLQQYDDTYHIEEFRGKYNYFGGNKEDDESPKETILRELEEEIIDANVLNCIKQRMIYIGTYLIVHPLGDNQYCAAYESIFLSVLDDNIFDDHITENPSICSEGNAKKVKITTSLIYNGAWDTPFVSDFMFKNIGKHMMIEYSLPFSLEKLHENIDPIEKILDRQQAISISGINKKSIIFVPGCYDIFHAGHIYHLRNIREKNKESIIVVGVGRDSTVEYLKGSGRPVLSEDIRAFQVASLPYVDYVVLHDDKMFNEEIDFEELMTCFKPNYMAIPLDNKNISLNAQFCLRHGIQTYYTDRSETFNLSTTGIIDKCKAIDL